jgi:CheY-like chemotaxis protein
MKLLIVDDHSAMRRMIGKVVSDMVSEIEECDDGAEALAAYHRCLPDWVLMDIEMGENCNTSDALVRVRSSKVTLLS